MEIKHQCVNNNIKKLLKKLNLLNLQPITNHVPYSDLKITDKDIILLAAQCISGWSKRGLCHYT